MEAKERMDLTPVQSINRVMKSGWCIDLVRYGQRIVNVLGPAFFFEDTQNGFLVPRGHSIPLNDQSAKR
jgi:hypothetical protein